MSCPGPHNLQHGGGHSERDSLTAERTESLNVCQTHPQRGEGLLSARLQLLYHGRKWLWVMRGAARVFGFLSSGFVPRESAVCNPQQKTTLRKQPHYSRLPLSERAGLNRLLCEVFPQDEILTYRAKKNHLVYEIKLSMDNNQHLQTVLTLTFLDSIDWKLVQKYFSILMNKKIFADSFSVD